MVNLDELLGSEVVKPQWVVEDMLARGTLVIVAGEPGVGKSVLSYALAFAVASGVPFLGRTTRPTSVLYFDEENSYPDMAQYCQWVWRGLGCPPVPMLKERLRIEHFSLNRDWEPVMLNAAVEHRPGLIVVDTATPALQIKDENDNAEASLKIQALRRAQRAAANDTTVLVLKHAKINDEEGYRRTVRGAKTWLGQADAVIFHTRAVGRPRKDGLSKTYLHPDKSRAFGLKDEITVLPAWTDGEPRGLTLTGVASEGKVGA